METVRDTVPMATVAAPVLAEERIGSMDLLRGVAVLGILLMNILGFALPFAASFDPTVAGGITDANRWTGSAVDREPDLAPPFPVRTARVGVAFPDLRRDPADAPSTSRAGRTVERGLTGRWPTGTP